MMDLNDEMNPEIDLKKIAESGQCFRWTEDENGYRVIAEGKILHLSAAGTFRESPFLSRYLDLDTDYRDIRNRIRKEQDPYLFAAAQCGRGIRILRQEPFETLITFILSQRKSIPAIKTCVEKLCTAAGSVIGEENSTLLHAFPLPEEILRLSETETAACGMGYRTEYVRMAAKMAAEGKIDPYELSVMEDEALLSKLMEIPGVGIKVASCTMLFGYHRLNVFPRDVWVNRVLDEHYREGFPFEQYAPYCGVMQQYLFWYRKNERV